MTEMIENTNEVVVDKDAELNDLRDLLEDKQIAYDELNSRFENFSRDVDRYVEIKEKQIADLEENIKTLMWVIKGLKQKEETPAPAQQSAR